MQASLRYGQYYSEYDIRATTTVKGTQDTLASQVLLGVNDRQTASDLHLAYQTWDSVSSNQQDLYVFIKKNVLAGYPVALGVYQVSCNQGMGI